MQDKSIIISSQHYLDDETVAAKMAAADYRVSLTPVFCLGGLSLQVVVDGHHSLAAAKAAGIEPVYSIVAAGANDIVDLIRSGNIDDAMDQLWVDGDWYDIATGELVF